MFVKMLSRKTARLQAIAAARIARRRRVFCRLLGMFLACPDSKDFQATSQIATLPRINEYTAIGLSPSTRFNASDTNAYF
jgi:hypothetical protein